MLIVITNTTKSPVTFRHLSGLLVDLEINESIIVDGDSKVLEYYKPLITIGLSVMSRTMLVRAFLNTDKSSKKDVSKVSDEKTTKVENSSKTIKQSSTNKDSTKVLTKTKK